MLQFRLKFDLLSWADKKWQGFGKKNEKQKNPNNEQNPDWKALTEVITTKRC